MRIQHETLMTIAFWRTMGKGSLVLKYPPVAGESDSRRRAVNGLIVLDGEFVQIPWAKAPELAGRPTMIVQTKAGRTDAVLVGQAVFSPILLMRQQPAIGPVQSVLLSTDTEPALSDLLRRQRVQEVTVPGPDTRSSPTKYPCVAVSHVDELHRRLGGEMVLGAHLGASEKQTPLLKVDAVILPDRPWRRAQADVDRWSQELVRGMRAIAVVSTSGTLGMGSAGFALVAQHLLRTAGAIEAQAITLVGRDDRALQFALAKIPGLSAEVIAPPA
jgi:hypothetical protein